MTTDKTSKHQHPWQASYAPGVHWPFEPSPRAAWQLLEDAVSQYTARPCLNFMGKIHTYAEVWEQVLQVAQGLQEMGIGKGDRIGLCLPNCPYFVIAYFGALRAGATVVNFNPLYTEKEISRQISDSGVKLMFTLDLKIIFNKVHAALGKTPLQHIVVCPLADALPKLQSILLRVFKFYELAHPEPQPQLQTFSQLTSKGNMPASVHVDPAKDVALIQYTGGTTGLPKGAMLSHRNVVANTEQIRLWLNDLNPDGEKFICVLPFFHVFAMTVTQNMALMTGSELILLPRFELKQLLKTIHKTRATLFVGVPTIYNAINNSPLSNKYDLSSIRYCVSGGAGLPQQVKEGFEKRTGCVLVEGYGLSEASPVVSCNPLHTGGKINSIGIPLPGTEARIIDLDNPKKILPTGEKGELVVRGPQVMLGYWNRDKETSDTFQDGWLRTGDVGHMDEDGFIFLTDRMKEIINCSGFKVYPRTVEEALYLHPAIAEALVIGVPHPYKGEAPKGFVTLKPGTHATVEELMHFATSHLNPIERPVAIEIRTSLPKTLVGKLSRKDLAEEEARKHENTTK